MFVSDELDGTEPPSDRRTTQQKSLNRGYRRRLLRVDSVRLKSAQVSPAADDGSSPGLVRRADLDGLHAGLGFSPGLVDAVAADHGHFR
jgi:hypothetical protein